MAPKSSLKLEAFTVFLMWFLLNLAALFLAAQAPKEAVAEADTNVTTMVWVNVHLGGKKTSWTHIFP